MKPPAWATLTAACTIAALSLSPASAETRQVSLNFSGLDLASDVGAESAALRIADAATRVCDRQSTGSRISERREAAACRDEAITSTLASLNAPKVSAYFAAGKLTAGPLTTARITNPISISSGRQSEARVRIGDLDMNAYSGQSVAMKRIEIAVDRVCGSRPTGRTLEEREAFETCKKEALDRAIASSGQPALVAMHTQSIGAGVTGATTER